MTHIGGVAGGVGVSLMRMEDALCRGRRDR
jgi:hypothetical protein